MRLRPQLYFPLDLNGCGGCTWATQMCAVCAHEADADLECLHRIFWDSLLLHLELINWLHQVASELWALDILLLPLQLWGYSYMWTCLVFTRVLEITLWSSCCAESIWPIEPSPALCSILEILLEKTCPVSLQYTYHNSAFSECHIEDCRLVGRWMILRKCVL